MTISTSYAAIMAKRRTLVMRYHLRGFTQREIVAALAREGEGQFLNPQTGRPWGLGTINRDIAWAEATWRAEVAQELGAHKARALAEIREVRREAWRQGDLHAVMRALGMEIDLLGLDAPLQVKLTWEDELREAGYDPSAIFERMVQAAAAGLREGPGGPDDGGGG